MNAVKTFAAFGLLITVGSFFSLGLQAQSFALGEQPNSASITAMVLRGEYDAVSEVKNSTIAALGTTPLEAFDDAVPDANQRNDHQQLIMLHNLHASQYLCLQPVAHGVSCSATTWVCNGGTKTTAARFLVQPGQSREIHLTAMVKPCIVGSGAATSYQVERVIKGPA